MLLRSVVAAEVAEFLAVVADCGHKLSEPVGVHLRLEVEEGSECVRETFSYPSKAGLGHFIHTYVTDGEPIPTFVGEPERIEIPDCIDCFTNEIWDNLDENNKISLYVRMTDLTTGEIEERLINKHTL